MDKQAPLVIIGAGRSGSTLLMRALTAHPEISFHGETQFLVPRLWSQLFDNRFWYNWQRFLATGPGCGCGRFDEVSETELSQLKIHIGSVISNTLFDTLGTRADAGIWGFKEIWNGSKSTTYPWDIYDNAFPRAHWVHLVRHPFEFVRSCAEWGCSSLSKDFLVERLEDWVSIVGMSRLRKSTENFSEIRYESMIQNPVESLESILGCVGLSWNAQCLEPFSWRVLGSNEGERVQVQETGRDQLASIVSGVVGLRQYMEEYNYEIPASYSFYEFKNSANSTSINLANLGTSCEAADVRDFRSKIKSLELRIKELEKELDSYR